MASRQPAGTEALPGSGRIPLWDQVPFMNFENIGGAAVGSAEGPRVGLQEQGVCDARALG